MSGLRLDVPAYDQATANFVGVILDKYAKANQLLGWLGPLQATRHAGPVRNISGPDPLDQSMRAIEASSYADLSIVRETDIGAYAEFIGRIAESYVRALSSGFFEQLDEMFNHTAKVTKATAETAKTLLDWDTLLDRLEEAEIEFDEAGEPILPDLHSGSQEQKEHLERTKAARYKQRLSEIIEMKRRNRSAEGRTRRLS